MPFWRVDRAGPQWLMDKFQRVIGYKDTKGRVYQLGQQPVNDAEVVADPDAQLLGSGVGAGGVVEDISSSPYTFAEVDKGKTKRWTGAGALTITAPQGLSMSTVNGNWWAKVYKEVGSGNITLQGDGTSAVVSVGGSLVMSADKGEVLIEQIVTNAFKASGDLGTLAPSDVVGFDEQVRDVVAAALVQGTNVTITVNDGADTITIASSGGGTSESANHADGNSWAIIPQYNGSGTWTATWTLSPTVEGTSTGQSGVLAGVANVSRARLAGTSGSQNSAGVRTATAIGGFPGSGAGEPPLCLSMSWIVADTIAWSGTVGGKFFAGWRASGGAIGNNVISGLRDCFGFGFDEAERYYKLISADASTQFTAALASNFEGNPNTANNLYFASMKFSPGSGDNRKIDWVFWERASNTMVTGTVTPTSSSSHMPTAGTAANAHIHRNTGTDAANIAKAATVDVLGMWGGRFTKL